MKLNENFNVEIKTESGTIKHGKKIERGNITVHLFWNKKEVGKISKDIAGMESQFFERLRITENQARMGRHIRQHEGEISSTIRSDCGRVVGSVKLRATRKFWKNYRKSISEAKFSVIHNDLLRISAKVKNGHFHNYSHSPLDILTVESVNFQKLRFEKVEKAFHGFCGAIDAYFTQNTPIPEPLIVEDETLDSYGTTVKIKVKFSLNKEILADRTALIQGFRSWFRGREGEAGNLQPTKPQKQEPVKPEIEKEITVISETAELTGQQGLTNEMISDAEWKRRELAEKKLKESLEKPYGNED